MVTTCIMCEGNAKGYGTSAKIAGILLKPLCSDCKQKCHTDPDRVIASYPHLFERNQPVSTNRLVKEPSTHMPTAHPISGQQSQRTAQGPSSAMPTIVSSLMNNKKTMGIIILIVGISLVLISPRLYWQTVSVGTDIYHPGGSLETTDFAGITFLFGVALLIVGCIIFAIGFTQLISTRPTTPAPTTQPVGTQSVSPKSVELGNTPDEVQSVMGQPDKIIDLGARVIHVYQDMKIIYVDGKVSDVQLS